MCPFAFSDAFQDELNRISNTDHIDEQKRLLSDIDEDENFLEISHAQIISIEGDKDYTIYPGESVRVDYLKGSSVDFYVYFDNIFPQKSTSFPLQLYDIRVTIKSLDPSVNLDFSFRKEKLSSTDSNKVGISQFTSLPKGQYPIYVSVTGRDVNRNVHSDKAVFNINSRIPANNTDISYQNDKNERDIYEIFVIVLVFAIVMSLTLMVMGFHIYKKSKRDQDEY